MTEERRSPGASADTVDRLIATHTDHAARKYRLYLANEHEDDTSPEGVAQREKQIRELNALTSMLKAWSTREPEFTSIIRSRKIVTDISEPRELFTARLVRVGDTLRIGKPQIQLNFHGLISAVHPEQVMETYQALSLKGDNPAKVLQDFYRRSKAQVLKINTLRVLRTNEGSIDLTPHAGIQFDWRNGEKDAYAKGLSFIGGTPHLTDRLGIKIGIVDFAKMQSRIYDLSGGLR